MGNTNDTVSYRRTDDIIAELYSLRAGLSVISHKADEIRSYESDADREKGSNRQVVALIAESERKLAKSEANLRNSESEIHELETHREEEVEKFVSKSSSVLGPRVNIDIAKTKKACTIFAIILAIFSVGLIIGMIVTHHMAFISGVVFCPVLVLLLLGYRVSLSSKEKEAHNDIASRLAKHRSDAKTYRSEVAKTKEELKKLYEKKAEQDGEIKKRISEIKSEIYDIKQDIAVYDSALISQYANMLNPADWQSIDLCIYYLQTGRADTIKECLLLVDRQRQTDEIIGAIHAAAEKVSSEIRSGFMALGTTMVTCFNSLSAQIESVSRSAINALGAIEQSNANLLSAAQLNAALIEKANTTSEQLLQDYRYAQNYK